MTSVSRARAICGHPGGARGAGAVRARGRVGPRRAHPRRPARAGAPDRRLPRGDRGRGRRRRARAGRPARDLSPAALPRDDPARRRADARRPRAAPDPRRRPRWRSRTRTSTSPRAAPPTRWPRRSGWARSTASGRCSGRPARKLVTFVPAGAADRLLESLARRGRRAGSATTATARSAARAPARSWAARAARPSRGRRGELAREPEVRLELLVPPAREAEVVAALLRAHPYEEPAYDLYDRRGEAHAAGRIGRPCEPALAGRAGRARGRGARRARAPSRGRARAARSRRVAVVPGSGEDFACAAREAGADVLVSGDLRHHAARARPRRRAGR